jgi:hypothetical protein
LDRKPNGRAELPGISQDRWEKERSESHPFTSFELPVLPDRIELPTSPLPKKRFYQKA